MSAPTSGPWWTAAKTPAGTPVLQIAADGSWETAKISATADPALVRQVAELAHNDIAVEVMWPGQAFVGVRWPVAEQHDAVAATARAGAVLRQQPVPAHIYLLALLGAPPSPEPDRVELGAVNAWQSVGPEVLWRRGEPFSVGLIESALTKHPRFATCPHPIAVEFAATTPRPCWVGVNLT